MRKTLEIVSLVLGWGAAALADIPATRTAMRDEFGPHPRLEGISVTCSIVYYNMCSGWFWTYSPFAPPAGRSHGDQIGVVFDLPAGCGKVPGTACTQLGFWWYWRYTVPGWGYTMTYDLWAVNAPYCKVGPSIGTLPGQDPIERWNHYPGLGSTTADLVAVTGTMDKGALPRWVTDNNVANSQAPIACAGWPGPIEAHSFYFGGYTTEYCPPQGFADNLGPVQFIMDASFSCEETSAEQASWGAIKALFR